MPPLVRAAAAARATTPGCPGWFLGPVLPTYIARTQNGAPPQFGTSLSGREFQYTNQSTCNFLEMFRKNHNRKRVLKDNFLVKRSFKKIIGF